jgi:hypothetical protein
MPMKPSLRRARPFAAFALAALVPLAACAAAGGRTTADTAAGPKPPRQCFWTRNVTSFAAPDDRTLYVRVGVRDVYRFELFGPCTGIDWTQRIALASRGSSQICSGIDADIITPSPIGPERCRARELRKLTPEEVAALPRLARP